MPETNDNQPQTAEQTLQATIENQQAQTADNKIVETVKDKLAKINGEDSPAEQQLENGGEKPQDDDKEKNKQAEGKPADGNSGEDDNQPADNKPAGTPEGEDGHEGEKKKPDFIKAMDKAFEKYAKDKTLGDDEWDIFMDGVKAMRDELVALRQKVNEQDGFISEQREQKFEAKIDSAFDGLGDEFAAKLGRGSGAKLDKAFLDNRNAILEKAYVLMLGYRAAGNPVSLENAIAEAAKSWAVDNMKPTQPKIQQPDRRNQFIQPPSSDNSPMAKSDEAAVKAAEKKLKEISMKE